MITVFADQHLYKLGEIVPDAIDLRFYNPEEGLPNQLEQADALLVRTVTNINKQTLNPVPKRLRFVGTASAGTDHLDIDYLEQHNIKTAHSPGCNARSVAEYVITGLLLWSESNKIDIEKETVGIIGVGHVGSELQKMLDTLGWKYRLYDPPRAERDQSFESVNLKELLNCSILTFHTPLQYKGKHATYHFLDQQKMADRHFKLVINTSRGGVVDENALLQAKTSGQIDDFIIDVWENEPNFSDEVAEKAFIATPHIAGYSIQAKFRATKMIVDQMIDYFSLGISSGSMPQKTEKLTALYKKKERGTFTNILKEVHPIYDYYYELEKLIGLPSREKQKSFRNLRTSFPYRNEFAYLHLPEPLFKKNPIFRELIRN